MLAPKKVLTKITNVQNEEQIFFINFELRFSENLKNQRKKIVGAWLAKLLF
jgi:hypothetical protein